MNDQSSAELEREAEAARERVADTAESIRRKLTAGQMIDEFSDMFTGGDLSGALGTLKTQVRDNPLPVLLVGAGIAWLAFGQGVAGGNGSGSRTQSRPRAAHRYNSADPTHHPTSGVDGSMMSSVTDGVKSAAASMTHAVSGAAESVSEAVSGMAGSASGTVSDMAGSLSDTADRLRHSMLSGASHMPRKLQRSASGLAEQEPLLIAALGLTIGAVAGAMFPASQFEKEEIGPHVDRLRDGAKDMLDKGMDSAGRVASRAYDALKEEADRQGLGSADGRTMGERVGEVVRSAAQSAEDAARDEFGASEGTSPRA